MRLYTQEEINNLLICQKRIITPPKQNFSANRGHQSNSMQLESTDGLYKFHVFMRINSKFIENFSIGLRYTPSDGSEHFNVLRCQGPHGGYKGTITADDSHFEYHIHLARAENIAEGKIAEKDGEFTDAYSTYEDALVYFIRRCNIIGAEEHFNFMRQLDLTDLLEDHL